jgi:glycosyltransferase involved in cell wall biosynthesis
VSKLLSTIVSKNEGLIEEEIVGLGRVMNVSITVVICLYNAEKYIRETLNSLSKQSCRDFKLLILDDCSTDNSRAIVNDYLKSVPFVSSEVLSFEKNNGTAYLRNFALGHVRTSLMMFFDSDDIAKSHLISNLNETMQSNNHIIAVGCHAKYIDSASKMIPGGIYIGPASEEEFYSKAQAGKLILMLPPTLFKREFAIEAGGYRNDGFPEGRVRYQDLSEDLDLWSRMSDFYDEGKVMITIPDELFFYRKHAASLSASRTSLIAMREKIRFIKYNLKRRRCDEPEIDFISFHQGFGVRERILNYFGDVAAYHYRAGGFAFLRRAYLMLVYHLAVSFIFSPAHFFDKVKSNLVKRH